MPYLEDHDPGNTKTTVSRTVSVEDIEAFAQLSGDRHPIHTDTAYARRRGHGDVVAHGPLVLALTQGLMAASGIFDDGALAFLGLSWQMTEPVHPGDTLIVYVAVQSRRESRKDPSRGIVEFAFRVLNQRGATVGEGIWTQLFAKRSGIA